MRGVQVLCSCLVLALTHVFVNATPPVRWKFYRDMKLTWNEASKFCRDLGGHLPVTDSYLTQTVFLHWIQEWKRKGHMNRDLWTGLYTPKKNIAPYVWERDGAHQSSDVSFWQTSAGEPNKRKVELCTRMPSNGLWRTKECSEEYGVVCEFYEDCCTYIRVSNTAALHTASSYQSDVTSLEECWSVCEGDVTCVSAAWHAETAACDASSDAQEVPLTLGEDQIASPYLLQRCFIAETTQWSNCFTFNDGSDKARPAEPQSVAPRNFQCTLTLNVPVETTTPPTDATTTMDQESTHSTMPDTTMSQITADTTMSQTSVDTTMSQTTADTTMSQTSVDTTMSQTTADTTMSQTTADTTQSQTTADTTMSQTTADTTVFQTTADTTQSHTTADTTMSQTTADTTVFQTTANATQSQTTPDTTMSQTTADTTMSQTTANTTVFQTTADTTMSQTTAEPTQSQTTADTPEPLASTTTQLVHDVNASSSSGVLRQCPCSCTERLTTAPPPPPLKIVLANSTSKFRRAKTSEWSSPTLSESAISISLMTIAAMVFLFALCPHPAAIERCFCSRGHKTSASCSS